jgi:hypothetical protein
VFEWLFRSTAFILLLKIYMADLLYTFYELHATEGIKLIKEYIFELYYLKTHRTHCAA